VCGHLLSVVVVLVVVSADSILDSARDSGAHRFDVARVCVSAVSDALWRSQQQQQQ
jgi:hypothetical protein